MADMTFGVNILPKDNTVSLGNSSKKWNIESPNLTGVPIAPTASTGTNTTQVANTAFVQTELNKKVTNYITLTRGTDINTIISSGFYFLHDQIINNPLEDWAYMIVISDTDRVQQIITSRFSNRIMTRNGYTVNGEHVWRNWQEIITTENVINNLASTDTNKPLSAAQGKSLNDNLANKINTSAIANNLTTTSAGYVLDARQGKALNDSKQDKACHNLGTANTVTDVLGLIRAYIGGSDDTKNYVSFNAYFGMGGSPDTSVFRAGTIYEGTVHRYLSGVYFGSFVNQIGDIVSVGTYDDNQTTHFHWSSMESVVQLAMINNSKLNGKIVSITDTYTFADLKAETVTDKPILFTNWTDSTNFPTVFGSGVRWYSADNSCKFLYYQNYEGRAWIRYLYSNDTQDSGWKEIITNAIFNTFKNSQIYLKTGTELGIDNTEILYVVIDITNSDGTCKAQIAQDYWGYADYRVYIRHFLNSWGTWKRIIKNSDVVNSLTSTSTENPLSAAQGKELNDTTVKLSGTQTIGGSKTFSSVVTIPSMEMMPGSSDGHGGYIDFHYNGSSADFTSRIIESSSGNVEINGISITGLNDKISTKNLGTITSLASLESILLSNADSLNEHDSKKICFAAAVSNYGLFIKDRVYDGILTVHHKSGNVLLFTVVLHESTTRMITVSYTSVNSQWYFDEYALNSKITGSLAVPDYANSTALLWSDDTSAIKDFTMTANGTISYSIKCGAAGSGAVRYHIGIAGTGTDDFSVIIHQVLIPNPDSDMAWQQVRNTFPVRSGDKIRFGRYANGSLREVRFIPNL